jgi:pyruvate carboxylase
MKIRVEGRWYFVEVEDPSSDPAVVLVDGQKFEVKLEDIASLIEAEKPSDENTFDPGSIMDNAREFKSPMPGTIITILVKTGEEVKVGQDIIILESMKMQQTLKADTNGTVVDIAVSEGDQILDGDLILLIK